MAIYEYVSGNELAKANALATICNVATPLLVLVASKVAGHNVSDMFRCVTI